MIPLKFMECASCWSTGIPRPAVRGGEPVPPMPARIHRPAKQSRLSGVRGGVWRTVKRQTIISLRAEVARLKESLVDGGLDGSQRTMVESELRWVVKQLIGREMKMRGR